MTTDESDLKLGDEVIAGLEFMLTPDITTYVDCRCRVVGMRLAGGQSAAPSSIFVEVQLLTGAHNTHITYFNSRGKEPDPVTVPLRRIRRLP